jgi:hypothetical protein
VKALIETEKKAVNTTKQSGLVNNFNSAVNQYKNTSSF